MTARRDTRYEGDVLATRSTREAAGPREVVIAPGLVVEHRATTFTGDVVGLERGYVSLRDRQGRERSFALSAGAFSIDGQPVTLVGPRPTPTAQTSRASGSVAGPTGPARTARASRIYVEGVHDAALLERVWGDDLRELGIVVEHLDGIDDLPATVRAFAPGPRRRLGVLVDHLVAGSKESRIAAQVDSAHVMVTGHPYVDVWQAVRPRALGIDAWPAVPKGRPWKEGVCEALGVADPREMWRRVLAAIDSYADLETPLVGAVEKLIDFLTDVDGEVTAT